MIGAVGRFISLGLLPAACGVTEPDPLERGLGAYCTLGPLDRAAVSVAEFVMRESGHNEVFAVYQGRFDHFLSTLGDAGWATPLKITDPQVDPTDETTIAVKARIWRVEDEGLAALQQIQERGKVCAVPERTKNG